MKVGHFSLAALLALTMAACSARPGAGAESVGETSEPVVVCAGGTTVKGVDVSVYQGSIDWAAVHSSGRDFAIARVSDGTTTPDGTFATNWAGIKAAGMVRGVYQFFRGSEDPTAQADLLVKAVGTLGAGDLSPVADVEVMDGVSGATLVANLATWVSVIKSKTGRTPIIYTAPGFWNALPSTGQFAGEVLWVANWQVSCPDTPTPWTAWSFWQSADNGSVPGISGAVDVDEFNGSLAQLQGTTGPAPYAAQFVGQSFPLASSALKMTEGETIASYIELKNVGSKTWDSSTRIGTTQPRDRSSVFADSSWLGPNRPASVQGTVPPGGTYKFVFNLHAPSKTGTYFEYFGVVQESVAWFSDPGQGGPVDDDLEVQVDVVAGAPGSGQDAGAATAEDGGAPSGGDDAGGTGTSSGPPAPTFDDAGNPVGVAEDGGATGEVNGGAGASGGKCSASPVRAGGAPWVMLVFALLGAASARRRGRASIG